MAIRMMVNKDKAGLPNVETVTDYPGHVAGALRHHMTCPHFSPTSEELGRDGVLYDDCLKASPGCYAHCWVAEPLYMETTHVGLVLELREFNGRDDSDFYAVVWNPETGRPGRVEYASTRGWTYPNGASVDATPEVKAAYEAYLDKAEAERASAAAELRAKTPAKGKTLRVVKGRKIPVGMVGTCVWYGEGKKYSRYGAAPKRVGLKDSGGTVHWTDANNVEVVLELECA